MFDSLALHAVMALNVVAQPVPDPAPKPSLPPLPTGPDWGKVEFVSDPFTLIVGIVMAVITMTGVAVILMAGIPWIAVRNNEKAAEYLTWVWGGVAGAVGGLFFHFFLTGSFNIVASILA